MITDYRTLLRALCDALAREEALRQSDAVEPVAEYCADARRLRDAVQQLRHESEMALKTTPEQRVPPIAPLVVIANGQRVALDALLQYLHQELARVQQEIADVERVRAIVERRDQATA